MMRCIKSNEKHDGEIVIFKTWLTRYLTFLACAVPLVGCGDKIVKIHGRVVDTAGRGIAGCDLFIHSEGAGYSSRVPNIPAEFELRVYFESSQFFTVACDGYAQPWRSELYELVLGINLFQTPIDLGTIMMKEEDLVLPQR